MAKNGKGVREKGLRFERDLIEYFDLTLGLKVARGTAGAQAFDNRKGSTDLFGLPKLGVEAKRTELFKLDEFMAQAVRNAGPSEYPVVIHRKSRQPLPEATVVLRLGDFIKLYDGFLRHSGFIKSADDK